MMILTLMVKTGKIHLLTTVNAKGYRSGPALRRLLLARASAGVELQLVHAQGVNGDRYYDSLSQVMLMTWYGGRRRLSQMSAAGTNALMR